VQVPRCYWPKTSQQVSLNGALVEVLFSQSASPSVVIVCSSPERLNLGFLTEGKLAAIFIKPSLGVPNWPVIYFINSVASSSFWRRCRGIVEDLCKGSFSHTHILYFVIVLLYFIYFTCIVLYQKPQKN
jgi:hypothetical protein